MENLSFNSNISVPERNEGASDCLRHEWPEVLGKSNDLAVAEQEKEKEQAATSWGSFPHAGSWLLGMESKAEWNKQNG